MRASALIFKGTTMSNTKATGVAYLDPEFSTMYATEEIGYSAAAQGTVTQLTSKSTAVTLDKSAGRITMNGALLAANTAASFTLTNSLISTADSIIVNVSGGGTAAAYTTYISSMTAGSAVVTLRNMTAGDLSEAVIINFAIIHGAS
jgi:1-aminocyclopropane-1-carboxylate deaminase/D-cysteine desulfhydrase-like pyridoxal-dependent ACC family enzyme